MDESFNGSNRLNSLYVKALENGDRENEELHELFKSALEGDGDSMNNLGAIYLQIGSRYLDDNNTAFTMALELFEIAIKNGSGAALTWLACMYKNGFGIQINKDKARILYEIAVERKVPHAEKLLDDLNNSVT